MTIDIVKLSDYPVLEKLAAALWQQEKAYHGAAVMIGAGFSRSAASSGDINRKLPLWHDLSSTLAKDLGAISNPDPLRLAEEYCAYFGKQSLHDLIRKEVNDAAWIPGELYTSLLQLPWSEVLTTNWDTLLERSSNEVHYPIYSVVTRQEELASSRSPRIVKLHGTINVTEDLTFTQEDYRKYPYQRAAFVNFARQVFIENELCLLGFSGDDPNFLQWTGWVRDQLAGHARRIYLVGALHLTAPKRKYLESINVAPIDLGELVSHLDEGDAQHTEATRIFLSTLKRLKPKQPWEWLPESVRRPKVSSEELVETTKNPGHAAALLEKQLPILEKDRKSYPGWLICPARQRMELGNQISDPYPSKNNLSEMAPDKREKLLYEITWRKKVTYEPIHLWLCEELIKICDPRKPTALTKQQQMEIALALLKNGRLFEESEYRSIEQETALILKNNAPYWPESKDELAYHQAIIARDRVDYPELERLIESIRETNPSWKLRKASLLAELGKFTDGEQLVAETYRELLAQHRSDKNSIYVFSRLGWAHWILRGIDALKPDNTFEPFPSTYQESKCSPVSHLDDIREKVSKALEEQQKQFEIEPSFEPGYYKDSSHTVVFNNTAHPFLLLDELFNSLGMPIRWSGINFLIEQASRLAELEDIDTQHRFSLALRAANSDTSPVLKKVFSRTQIACLSQIDADYLINTCINALDYWTEKKSQRKDEWEWGNYVLERLRVFMEVLARASVRSSSEQAKEIFRRAITIGKDTAFQHFWLHDSLTHLLDYSLKSVPENQQHELLFDALSFPLKREINFQTHSKWPNPVIRPTEPRGHNTTLDRRIDEIIDAISPCSLESASALLRLSPLLECNFLTGDEELKISQKIWGKNSDFKILPELGLLKCSILNYPAPDESAAKELVKQYLFKAKDGHLFDSSLLVDIANAAMNVKAPLFPSEEEAELYFNKLTDWRPSNNPNDLFGYTEREEKRKGELIGEVLSSSISPILPTTFLTRENFDKLFSFYTETGYPNVLVAFVRFAIENKCLSGQVERTIRRGLQDQNPNTVAHSSYALLEWRKREDSPAIQALISRLVYLIESNRQIGLPALLWTAHQMYNENCLSKEDIDSLTDILPVIFDDSDYKNILPASREAVSSSLYRANCVKLARELLTNSTTDNDELERILEEAILDPLPEVRFA